jgi:hypothetical protein
MWRYVRFVRRSAGREPDTFLIGGPQVTSSGFDDPSAETLLVDLSESAIEQMAAELAAVAGTEPFVEMVHKIRSAPPEEQLDTCREEADVVKMARKVALPPTLRMSPRTFDDPPHADSGDLPLISRDRGRTTVMANGRVVTIDEPYDECVESNDNENEFAPTTTDSLAGVDSEGVDEDHRREQRQRVIQEAIGKIGSFVTTPAFRALMEECFAKDSAERPAFVSNVVLNEDERVRRGIIVPDDMVVLRSSFDDGRPTLFAVSKLVDLAQPWHRVTVTFDDGPGTNARFAGSTA